MKNLGFVQLSGLFLQVFNCISIHGEVRKVRGLSTYQLICFLVEDVWVQSIPECPSLHVKSCHPSCTLLFLLSHLGQGFGM